MTKQELKKKRKQIVESKGYKEWQPQQEKLIARRKEAQKNAEIQRRKVELSTREEAQSAFGRNAQRKEYFKPTPITSTESNVNKIFQQIMEEEQKEEKKIEPSNKLFQNLDVSINKEKPGITTPKNVDAQLSQKDLDRLAKMNRKERVEALRGRGEKTLQEAELYALTKRNEETEKKVNESKGINKFLAANEYLGKEFMQNTLSSFGQIKATAEHIQGRDKDLSDLEYAQQYQEAISPLGQNVNSRFLQNLGMAVEGVGQQTPQILLGASGAGALVGGFTEFSNAYNEMTLEDPDNKTKTMVTALLKGTVAGGLEAALGLFGGSKLDKLSKAQLSGIKNKLVRNVMSTGYDVAGEITEEQLENMIGYVIDKAVNDKDITMEQAIKEAEATFKQTGLTTILMSALGLGGNTRGEVNRISERTNWVNQLNVTTSQKTELRRLAQNENISNEELYNQVMKIEQENAYQDTAYENVIKNAESTKKQQLTIENKEVLNQSQQTTLKQGEMAQKQASSQPLGNEKYTIKMPNSNYKFEKTGNINEDNLDESMSKYFNNSEATKKLNTTLKKIMNDKNLSIKFDDTITDEAGNIIDGKYENGSITINPNSSKAFEYVATHELTHAIGTDEMLKMVDNYRKSNLEFNEKVETLLKNYNKSELTEEALADVSAELFGTQEFIANVKNTNPNLFQKIYNEIKYLWHQFRGYKNQNQFVEDLYNKWTAAYNSKTELNQTTKYSLAGEKALFADFSKLEKAKEMLKDNKDLDDIWIKTGWTKGDDGKWRFEIDDNKFDIKENALAPDTEKPLHEILEAEELFDNYPELADINVITTKLEEGVNGSYERLGNVIYLSNDLISTTTQNKNYKFLGLHNQHKAFVKLLHEIQHYIQKQEGFARGGNVDEMRSVKNSKLRKLGERIDTLTAQYNKEIDEYRNSIHYNETVEELFKIDNPNERSEALYNYRESVKATPRYKEIEKIDNQIKELENEFYELEDMSPYYLYSRLGGEQESRWVEARIETPTERRKNKRPQYTNKNTIFAETDDLMYNKQQRGNDDAIQLGNNLSTTSKGGQEPGTSRRSGTSGEQSTKTSSDGNIYRNIEGNNTIEGDNIQRGEANIGENNQGLEESSSFLMQDNKGRVLTQEEQDFINDNGITDENGNALELYHGTPYKGEINEFDSGLAGSNTMSDFDGIYFTDNKDIAEDFSYQQLQGNSNLTYKRGEKGQVINAYLKSKKTLNLNELTDADIDNLAPYLDKNKAVDGAEFALNMMKQMNKYKNAQGVKFYLDMKALQNAGYDMIIADMGGNYKGSNEYIVFNKDQIKKQDNTQNIVTDSKGKSLTKEQQYYFKDSKVRDEKGNLKTLYHGTPNEFNIFNYDKLGTNTSSLGAGFYFTDNESTGKEYSRGDGFVKEVYLDIKKPMKYGQTTITKNEFRRFVDAVNKATEGRLVEDYGDINDVVMEYDYGGDDIDLVNSIHNASGLSWEKTYEILRDSIGYDGLIEENFLNKGETIYVAFNPNQIKNVNNTKPTENPDIRYSKQNAEWYDYVQDTFKTEGTRTTKEQIGLDTEIVENEEYTPTQKAINYEQRQKNNFKRNMSDMLGISQYNKNNKSIFNDAIDEMQKEYNATGTISQETKDRVFENMYNGLIKEDVAFYNENKEIKNEIRNTTLYISDETKADITDYADFKRSVFGNVRLSNDKTDMPIDTFYKELSSQRPDLFPESIITTSEQLKRIAEVSKSIRKSERNLAAYNNNMEAAEYKKWAKNEFEIQTSRLQEQFAFVNKYNESKQAEFEKKNVPYSRPDVAEIKSIYQNRNEIRKEVEKQERNLLLTDREKAIVNRLLNDEMDVSEIMPGYNKEGIIKSYYARQQLDYLDKEVKRYKQDKKQELYDMSENLISGIKDWKDKKVGLQYSRETAQRNIRDIMSKNEAERINRELFDPIQENTANQIRFINDYNKQIEELDLDKKAKFEWKDSDGKEIKIDEATLAQLLIEKKIDENYLTQVGADVEKIRNAADTFSRILNEVVDMMDDVYVEFGYAPVERRKNYFPHFIENKPDTLFSKIANALNFSTDVVELPTDIAGRTESFKPGRAFNRNILKRTTEKTDYNALKAIDMYLQGASDIIYHTADIQKLRAFQEAIRDNYRDVEIQKKILEIEENTEMTADERAEKIKEIKENIKTPLPKLVEWLDEYTNLLANKKSSGDRQTEKDLNRKMYTTMQEIEGKIASNLIGGNLSVSLTNIAPLFQAMGTTELGNIFVGMVQTAQNDIKNFNNKGDNFSYASDFLTSRRGNELLQKQTVKQNISNVAGIPMQVIDNFVSESIVRAKYRENIKKGMDNDAALKAADTYARNLMADRSKGALPTIFARKNPVSKLMTSFQVEPNNIISNYFKDMKYDAETKSQLAWQAVKLSAASFVFNEVLKSIRGGSDVIPNPIGIASRLIALAMTNLNDDEEDDLDEMEVLKEIGSDILGSIPFGTTIANTLSLVGVEGFEDTGKFMTSNALPSVTKLIGLADEEVAPEYRKQTLIEELSKPLIYLGLPTAGSQISKSAKGIKAFVEGGSYKYNKKGERQLQFPVEQNVTNAVKSTVFGKYSLPGGTKYIDEGFKSLNGKETMVYEQSNVEFDELKAYFAYGKKDGVKKKDKINYVESMDISSGDKWNLYKHNIISNTEREDGTSQLSDAEFVINNNMATPEEYMKMYSKAERNEVEFPGTETLQELKDSGLSLKTYMDYKTKLTLGNRKKKAEYEAQNNMPLSKEESEKRKSLNTEEKIALLEKYSDREKALIYENYIGKSDTVYQHLKQLTGDNVRINDYLDYKIADLDSDRKNDGTKKGKAIPGSAEKKLVNFLNNSKLSNIERIYIYGQTYELDNSQRQQFQNYIKKLNLPYAEEKEIWLDLSSSNVVEMSNGSIEWK